MAPKKKKGVSVRLLDLQREIGVEELPQNSLKSMTLPEEGDKEAPALDKDSLPSGNWRLLSNQERGNEGRKVSGHGDFDGFRSRGPYFQESEKGRDGPSSLRFSPGEGRFSNHFRPTTSSYADDADFEELRHGPRSGSHRDVEDIDFGDIRTGSRPEREEGGDSMAHTHVDDIDFGDIRSLPRETPIERHTRNDAIDFSDIRTRPKETTPLIERSQRDRIIEDVDFDALRSGSRDPPTDKDRFSRPGRSETINDGHRENVEDGPSFRFSREKFSTPARGTETAEAGWRTHDERPAHLKFGSRLKKIQKGGEEATFQMLATTDATTPSGHTLSTPDSSLPSFHSSHPSFSPSAAPPLSTEGTFPASSGGVDTEKSRQRLSDGDSTEATPPQREEVTNLDQPKAETLSSKESTTWVEASEGGTAVELPVASKKEPAVVALETKNKEEMRIAEALLSPETSKVEELMVVIEAEENLPVVEVMKAEEIPLVVEVMKAEEKPADSEILQVGKVAEPASFSSGMLETTMETELAVLEKPLFTKEIFSEPKETVTTPLPTETPPFFEKSGEKGVESEFLKKPSTVSGEKEGTPAVPRFVPRWKLQEREKREGKSNFLRPGMDTSHPLSSSGLRSAKGDAIFQKVVEKKLKQTPDGLSSLNETIPTKKEKSIKRPLVASSEYTEEKNSYLFEIKKQLYEHNEEDMYMFTDMVSSYLMKQIDLETIKMKGDALEKPLFTSNGIVPAVILLARLILLCKDCTSTEEVLVEINKGKELLKYALENAPIASPQLYFLRESVDMVSKIGLPRLSKSTAFLEALWDSFYLLNVIDEATFTQWYDDDSDDTPGRMYALFQVMPWLRWLFNSSIGDDSDVNIRETETSVMDVQETEEIDAHLEKREINEKTKRKITRAGVKSLVG